MTFCKGEKDIPSGTADLAAIQRFNFLSDLSRTFFSLDASFRAK